MIAVELYRQVRRRRTFILFLFLVGLPAVAAIAASSDSGRRPGSVGTQALFDVSTASGLNHALASLAFMSAFFLVIAVCFFAGDSIASDSSWGTLRYLLIRPVPRGRLFVSKLAVVFGLALAAVSAVVVSGLVSGSIAFGWGSVITPFGPAMSTSSALARLALAVVAVTWSLAGVMSFAYLLSVFTDSAAGAIGGGVGLMVVSSILDGLDSLRFMHPVLPTHYWGAWSRLFFRLPPGGRSFLGDRVPDISLDPMVKDAVVQLVYVVLFISVAAWWFRRKDILS